jgi:hypothetical protein
MYNGQLFKGLIHVVVFAVLVSITDSHGIFGIFVGAWVLYQSFEAFQTAKARRDGLPLPDPFGLNELGSWLNLWSVDSSKAARIRGVPHPGKPAQTPPPTAQGFPSQQATAPPSSEARGPGSAGGAGAWTSTSGFGTAPPYTAPGGWNPVGGSEYEAGYGTGYSPPPYTAPYAGPNPDPYAGSYSAPSGGYTSYSGPNPPGPFVPPIPPMPPGSVGRYGYRGKEPVWAFILIGLGLIFLLNTMGFVGHVFHFAWPLLLIAFGIWMIIRRMGSTRGGSK